MELDWSYPRPVSMAHTDWDEQDEHMSTVSPTTYYARRPRSTVNPVPLPGPPPAHPIPSVPYDQFEGSSYSAYSRPAASANLAAVAAYPQSQPANYAHPYFSPPASSPYNLSDSPPRSQLRQATEPQHQDIMPERLLLSPTEPPNDPPSTSASNERRPSSRRALTRALELAREAVRLDSTNDDPYAAVAAYGRSVSLLSEVMERVMRGEDTTESHRRRNGRRRSVVAQEEEVRRLRSIHDTYAERMNILSLIYNIPIDAHSPSSAYPSSVSTSTDSTQPPSPSDTSPSDTDNPQYSPNTLPGDSYLRPNKINGFHDNEDGVEAIGSAMFNLDTAASPSHSTATTPHASMSPTSRTFESAHSANPYSNGVVYGRARTSTLPQARVVSQVGRSRASSALPPAAPPPTNSLPPAPAPILVEPLPEPPITRPRGSSVSHKRTGSGQRLLPLNEEVERYDESVRKNNDDDELRRPRSKSVLAAQRHYNDSQPLPPLPPISQSNTPVTPRFKEQSPPPSPDMPNYNRPRGESNFSSSSEANVPIALPSPAINQSTLNGTISMRRGKSSAPPSSSNSPDMDSSPSSSGSIPTLSKLAASSTPANAASSMVKGRSRALSQPGRRPSIVSTKKRSSPNQATFPTQGSSPGSRKVSIPSKLNPNVPPPSITINTAQLSPQSVMTATTANMLVPPPPIAPENLPSAPLSPLPPLPPPDPLRQPYHMMNLLRRTMTSKTGGYVTRRLHVPFEVWSQGGAKLSNIPEKIRVVEVLLSALEEVQNCSAEIFGAGNVSSGLVMGIGSIGHKDGEAWGSKLEEFSAVCDGLVSNFGKKLGVGEGFVTKKSGGLNAWSNRLTRQFDKLTTGKNLDSPTTYVQGLAKLFLQTQLLDEHTKALSATPVAPAYAAFPVEMRSSLEAKLRHASEFFARVVLTFVIRDLSQLLDKYVKKCEKWLAE